MDGGKGGWVEGKLRVTGRDGGKEGVAFSPSLSLSLLLSWLIYGKARVLEVKYVCFFFKIGSGGMVGGGVR